MEAGRRRAGFLAWLEPTRTRSTVVAMRNLGSHQGGGVALCRRGLTEAEVDVFEASFGDLFDELFGSCR